MDPPKLTTEETYKNIILAQGLPVDIETIDGFSLCWIGPRTAKEVIVGGLIMYAYDAHIQIQINGYKAMKANAKDVSIVIVNYGICPGAPYPTQLRQMVATVQHLLQKRTPESISLSGDSAGGMLVLALLLHHSHPHPDVAPYNLPHGTRFGEAFLISPGVAITDTASSHQEPVKDILSLEMLGQLWSVITSTSESGIQMPNFWIAPSTAPEEWWQGLPVGKISIAVGGWELLKDDILIVADNMKKYHDREIDTRVFPNELHDQALLDLMTGVTEDKGSTTYWKSWFQHF